MRNADEADLEPEEAVRVQLMQLIADTLTQEVLSPFHLTRLELYPNS